MGKQADVCAITSRVFGSAGRLLRPSHRVPGLLKAAGLLLVALVLCPLHGKAQTLYSFTGGAGGQYPYGGLTAGSNGVFYGTTPYGGVAPGCSMPQPPPYCGTVFQLTPPTAPGQAWTKSVIYFFPDFDVPLSSPTVGPRGELYGTTAFGETVYELEPPSTPGGTWTETTLYDFSTGNALSQEPRGGVVLGKNGVLYGTVENAQFQDNCESHLSCGAVYSLTPPASPGGKWTYQTLYTFQGGGGDGYTDGASPQTALVLGSKGELYGVTAYGGSSSLCVQDLLSSPGPDENPTPGCGTVFELQPPASTGGAWTETSLYSFQGRADGGYPNTVLYHDGALYGSVTFGGDPGNCGGVGCGGVFRLDQPLTPGGSWHEQVIYSFKRGSDGLFPDGGVAFGANGILYGTTRDGGDSSACPQDPGCGIVFQLRPPVAPSEEWSESVLHRFAVTDGEQPTGAVVIGNDGNVYGTTYYGGASSNCVGGCGVVFEVKTNTAEEIQQQGRQ